MPGSSASSRGVSRKTPTCPSRFEPRRIEEDAHLPLALHAASLRAFAQDRGRHDIAGAQFIDKPVALAVDQLGTGGTGSLRDQAASQVTGMGNAGWVVLKAVHLA